MGVGMNLMNSQYKMDTPPLPLCRGSLPPCPVLALALAQPLPQTPPAVRVTISLQNSCFHTGTADVTIPTPIPFPQALRERTRTKYQDRSQEVAWPASGPGLNSRLPAAQSQSVLYLTCMQVVAQTDLEVCREKTAGMHVPVSWPHSLGHTL